MTELVRNVQPSVHAVHEATVHDKEVALRDEAAYLLATERPKGAVGRDEGEWVKERWGRLLNNW